MTIKKLKERLVKRLALQRSLLSLNTPAKGRTVLLLGLGLALGLSGCGLRPPDARPAAAPGGGLGNARAEGTAAPTVAAVRSTPAPKPGLPEEGRFQPAAESAGLKLWVDPLTAHFKVEQKAGGQVWRSYPNPAAWPAETIGGTWKNNLLSPIMAEYIDAANSKSQAKLISWLEDKGALEGFQLTKDGFQAAFRFTGTGFRIPVEVKLGADYVETTIRDEGIEEGKLSLLNLKLYPLFGAEPSAGQDGYLLIPDGSGALIRFKPNLTGDKSVYRENVYGPDDAFFTENLARDPVRLPVFGLKSGQQGFVGVLTSGEEYAKVFAAPSGALGSSNWITPEWQYRIKFFQGTSRRGNTGFFTYSKERFTATARTARYYFLEAGHSDYADMAARYRRHLTEEQGLKKLVPKSSHVPFYADLIGADSKKGLLSDQYLKGTTTDEALQLVRDLRSKGLDNLIIHYTGWQEGGYSSSGGLLPVDSRLGGNEGMKRFITEARSLDVPVFLTADYTINNNGKDGFWPVFHGRRNLAGTVIEWENRENYERTTQVSPKFYAKLAEEDLPEYRELGASGLLFVNGIGQVLGSDFNSGYPATRGDVLQIHKDLLSRTRGELGAVAAENTNAYALGQVQHIHRLTDRHSFDLFVDEPVPFIQIALHGLVTYTADWANQRTDYRADYLRSVEYGAYPAYVFTGSPSEALKGAYSQNRFSTDYRVWIGQAAEEYSRINEALGGVQDRFITAHRTLAPGVKKTVYEGGHTVIVNYNETPYTDGSLQVPPRDFIVTKGGEAG
ncbi:DUF5696 domain-containing protein [Paenibacillus mucilaginosus]|uniref:Uncharacterized protein n=1 Tax=Paenibacillus mucilaginosus (strain KNP414) TaxID=1036673 RepID=F8F9C7_PAEMK|nr:DUF5696 domain-containing protein [Paenibacillus mucilaginosus]AEI43055.1 hypothetical protein KNP414_04525 [Paenibacillus mucilaginosus KNP414]MCG7215994.1 DUF5696 domain-containing protein [Paenibacillus mucilaginosus]WDM24677.1 hypothetical protein KCX80_19445 [Paenibacillus mucilaginosus]